MFYDCGIEPVLSRKCESEVVEGCDLEPVCVEDESPVCGDEVMMRYCVIPSYRGKCCKSCSGFESN